MRKEGEAKRGNFQITWTSFFSLPWTLGRKKSFLEFVWENVPASFSLFFDPILNVPLLLYKNAPYMKHKAKNAQKNKFSQVSKVRWPVWILWVKLRSMTDNKSLNIRILNTLIFGFAYLPIYFLLFHITKYEYIRFWWNNVSFA